jgi:hypothetical protein
MMVLTTQYLDTIKEIGAQAKTNTILLPHSPGGLTESFTQLQQAVAVGHIMGNDGEPPTPSLGATTAPTASVPRTSPPPPQTRPRS